MSKARTAQRKGAGQPPISAHPAFPAIVALWFAALFGIGTLVLPDILIERLVDATGIAVVVPAAAPPIGITAKLTLAAMAAVFGVVAGIFVARKVVESQTATKPAQSPRKAARNQEEAPAKRPIVATEELGEEGLGPVADDDDQPAQAGKPPLPGRRRALSVTDDSGTSQYLSHVPLPGEGYPGERGQQAAIRSFDGPLEFETADPANRRDGSNLVPDAPDLAELHAEEHGEILGDLRNPATAEAPRPFDVPLAFPVQPDMGGDGADYHASPAQDDQTPREPGPVLFGMPHEEDSMSSNSRGGQPAPSASDNPFGNHTAPPAEEAPRQVFGAPQPAPFAPPPAPVFASHSFAPTGFAAAPSAGEAAPAAPAAALAELSMSELIARFARAMQAHDAAPAPTPATDDPFEQAEPAVPFGLAQPEEQDPAAASASEAPIAMPSFAPPQPTPEIAASAAERTNPLPAALRPLDLGAFEEDDGEDDPFAATPGFSFGVPERMFARPAEVAAAPAPAPFAAPAEPAMPAAFADPLAGAEDEDDDGNDDAYSSLLSMKSPLGIHREFPRVEEDDEAALAGAPEAVVVFPGQQAPTTNAARPFDAPVGIEAPGGLSRAVPTMPAQRPADPAETERALREALEKLQRMSGAA
ncbi:hypothetical protein LY632_03495 [Erythrobacter sp. SDW2]|uniref:hypothetical protein n=1 Tax=Erythrobacter sp. SDW2 TaxID=2907154 RepID=UPI001F42FB41|nr:hypothetical protein [Erythrobacter sp. SDW2]UIP07475.1 hypothetical protein LY632_03495 [Erythrobacter sp. SDW2]